MDKENRMVLPEAVTTALSLLNEAGFEAYTVGGCTRDSILGTDPKDWDITTSALPEETLAVFQDYRTIETGLKHGTVAVRISHQTLEITTYRVDGTYEDSRHPDKVTFTRSLSEDLARRDFTMNAIAYHPAEGFVDLYDGAKDIASKTIRCVGNPKTRFTEDALRMLRALRFSSTLGFSIEEETSLAIHSLKERILYVAEERIATELLQLLCGAHVADVLLEYKDVFAVLIPELKPCFGFAQHNKYHVYDVYEHIVRSVAAVEPEPELRLAMLLHDIGKPETFFLDEQNVGHFYGHAKASVRMAEDILSRLRLPNKLQTEVLTLVEYHDYPLEADRKILRRRLHKFGKTTLQNLLKVQRADVSAQNPEFLDRLQTLKEIELSLEHLLLEKPAFRIQDLAITGEDLQALGMKPGPDMGKLLNELLQKVMAEELPNQRFALLDYAAERIL